MNNYTIYLIHIKTYYLFMKKMFYKNVELFNTNINRNPQKLKPEPKSVPKKTKGTSSWYEYINYSINRMFYMLIFFIGCYDCRSLCPIFSGNSNVIIDNFYCIIIILIPIWANNRSIAMILTVKFCHQRILLKRYKKYK